MSRVTVYASQGSSDSRHTALEMHAIRMIIEREACLEALQQLADEFASPQSKKARPWKLVDNLTRQYRKASVAAVEAIRKWQVGIGASDAAFVWKQTNYLRKMCTDTDFFATAREMLKGVAVPLAKNPLLAPIALTDPLLRENEATLLDGLRRAEKPVDDNGSGVVDMDRLCAALRTLFAELQHVDGIERPSSAAAHAHPTSKPNEASVVAPGDRLAAMEHHLNHARQVLATMETRRKELVDQMHVVQEKMEMATLPAKARALQTKHAALNNELKALMGDKYKRRNELMRQEATFKMQQGKKHVKPIASVVEKELQDVVEADRLAREQRLAMLVPSKASLVTMNETDVFEWVKGLGLDAAAEKLRRMGIDGRLLAVSTDADLQELGIDIRLHRVKILREVHAARDASR
ncbi:hypothetical protein H310_08271 [Aphanomyces invadans]|uniref:SAM domain-containing protein n=1 Tax=Aphanomyces invadans TaxID=157072 RepID=A0A024U135_9STRA|nr:hypothetical protein H310_08271 [Aphanomyces invadans]ETV99621.1 hypothetical protein H310_08271 [Aphanomyces invadans]|eukprot:XP_008872177.1 hypothetical protein H310_08271 [Aphanomyces invadans]